jgi:hypothetical protein
MHFTITCRCFLCVCIYFHLCMWGSDSVVIIIIIIISIIISYMEYWHPVLEYLLSSLRILWFFSVSPDKSGISHTRHNHFHTLFDSCSRIILSYDDATYGLKNVIKWMWDLTWGAQHLHTYLEVSVATAF